jgi:hypothetical protein
MDFKAKFAKEKTKSLGKLFSLATLNLKSKKGIYEK